MKAAIFVKGGAPLSIVDMPDPAPEPDEVIIRVSRCGVCGTDLHATGEHGRGLHPGAQLGHEFAGEVVEIGRDVRGVALGRNVAALPVVGCGHCEYCLTGLDVLCRSMVRYSRGLAEYARVHVRGLTVLPPHLAVEDGALVEPVAVGCRAVRLAALDPGNRVLVIGSGPIGLSVLFWLRQRLDVAPVMLSRSRRREPIAKAMGAGAFVTEGDMAAAEIEAVLGGAPDVVFECAGVAGSLTRSVELVRPQGRIVALGYSMASEPLIPAAALIKDLTIRFSIVYTRDDFQHTASAIADDPEAARAMVTKTVPFADFPDAFEAMRSGQGGDGKLLLAPWGRT